MFAPNSLSMMRSYLDVSSEICPKHFAAVSWKSRGIPYLKTRTQENFMGFKMGCNLFIGQFKKIFHYN
jgi:hypothetical protein